MRSHIPLGRVHDVQIGLHTSWLIIAVLLTLSLTGHFHAEHPDWSPTVVWTSAVVLALLFFGTILVHELSHALVAQSRGLPVHSITLFALGGVAQIDKEANDARTEFLVAAVGPLTSAVLGGLCLVVAWSQGWEPAETPETPLLSMLVWLGYINLMLAAFNLIPAYPLDGGRVVHALMWWATGRMESSTRLAAGLGQLIAFGFIVWGLLRFFNGEGLSGLWTVFIGWFILDAARASSTQLEVNSALSNVRVADIMARDYPSVEVRSDLQHFVDELVLRTGRRCFIAVKDGTIAGLVTAHEVRQVERQRWRTTTVGEVMRPIDRLHAVAPELPVTEALQQMLREDVNQVPVMAEGQLQGVLSRDHILRLLQTRAALDV